MENLENKPFKLRSYTKSELAVQYNPQLSIAGARQVLRRWIVKNADLRNELLQCGYTASSHILTPKQVSLVVRYLGEP